MGRHNPHGSRPRHGKRILGNARNRKAVPSTAGNADAKTLVAAHKQTAVAKNQVVSARQPASSGEVSWLAADAAVVGAAHLRANPPKPCQDAVLTDCAGRALAVLADGAGSAPVSHVGAHAVVVGVRRLCRTLETTLASILDSEQPSPALSKAIVQQIVTHAKGILVDLSEEHVRAPEDFRCTLLLWIAGRQRALWVKVGDGCLLAESGGQCQCVGPAGKGEFANQTRFIDQRLESGHWAWGEIDATQLTGLAAMSDGSAERLVASDNGRVSPAVSKLLRGVTEAQVGNREVFSLLSEAAFWQGTSGDDKSLALIARDLSRC